MPVQLPFGLDRALRLVRVDFPPRHRQPPAGLLVTATVLSLAGSLGADALLVTIGERVFPATRATVTSSSPTTPS